MLPIPPAQRTKIALWLACSESHSIAEGERMALVLIPASGGMQQRSKCDGSTLDRSGDTQDSRRRTRALARGDQGRTLGWGAPADSRRARCLAGWLRWRHHATYRSYRWFRPRPASGFTGDFEFRGRL